MQAEEETTVDPQAEDQVVDERVSNRLRRWRPLLLAGLLMFVASLVIYSVNGQESDAYLSPDNAHSSGARALSELLGDYGVGVSTVVTREQALIAAQDGATIVVTNPSDLDEGTATALSDTGADIVVLGTSYYLPDGFSEVAETSSSAFTDSAIPALCTDIDASAAETISHSDFSLTLSSPDSSAQGCFPVAEDNFALVVEQRDQGGTLYLLADDTLATNEHLAEDGNAALLIRIMGHNEKVAWLDASTMRSSAVWDSPAYPRWLPVLVFQLLILAGVAALVMGRRFGPLVSEPLPVVVRAAETTLGRGRLYRKAGDRQHAAAALRTGTAVRLGRRLGLPVNASSKDLVLAVSAATNYPEQAVEQLLYGPAPTTDNSLGTLAQSLTQLENEVKHR